ncbi:MAG: NAD-binding protein, partial [Acidobacteriota bacterium]
VIVAGLGEVGSRVVETLGAAGVHTLTVDRRSDVGAEVVGDVHDRQTLTKLPLADARTLVLALDSDEATLFTTLLMRGLSPTVQIVARVNQETNVERIYRAGADLAVSLSQLTSSLLAEELLGERIVSVGGLKLFRWCPNSAGGRSLAELDLRQRLGASVVAVERDGRVDLALSPDLVLQSEDRVYLAGDDHAVEAARRLGGHLS